MTEKRFRITISNTNTVCFVDFVENKQLMSITFKNNFDAVDCKNALMWQCDLLNNLHEENKELKEEKELLRNKLDRIEDILPHYLSCAEISEFHSKTYEEDIALMKCWNKRYQK